MKSISELPMKGGVRSFDTAQIGDQYNSNETEHAIYWPDQKEEIERRASELNCEALFIPGVWSDPSKERFDDSKNIDGMLIEFKAK